MTDCIIGTPVWDRAWALPIWIQSVRANVNPADTGLVFVVPSTDRATREAIAEHTTGFDWVEVIRDRGTQSERRERPKSNHATLATVRNQALSLASRAGPRHYISWDSDILLPPDSIEQMRLRGVPIICPWVWLNRHPPRSTNWYHHPLDDEDDANGTGGVYKKVLYQLPINASAMSWDPVYRGRAIHYPADEFLIRAQGMWSCDVAMGVQVMDHRAYRVAHYQPHPDGADIPFCWQLESRGVSRFCDGDVIGLHLYDRSAKECELGWPDVMQLAKQVPLASRWTGNRTAQFRAIGFFDPSEGEQAA